jgi:allantoin racemase
MTFRLGLLNPNTDMRHTEAMAAVARDVLPEPSEVLAASPGRGPSSIESAADAVVAGAEVLSLLRSQPPQDAYLIACFGDPGLDAARELTDAPVIGVGEAAFRAVGLVATRFGVVTTLPRGVPAIEEAAYRYGVASRLISVEALEIPVSEQGRAYPATTEAIIAASGRLVAARAEAVVLACGGMAEVATAVQQRLGVPVCDGVAFGALLAHALWRAGLRTSSAGAYARPEPIPYRGMPAFTEMRG